ncbi:MAG: hypothetical protein KZQ89_15135 [Candidatus Thiodiazotropha sp. (ex Lucinoma kastoroae)]|nr:hypothetical protein [Candidatus Thiodiazotropha sp. (ex Lucinoma kastoroae)]
MSKSISPKAQGGEVTYELHSLGWKTFQSLCVTVMGEVWGQVVQGFFDSHDGGRDGAFHGTWTPVNGESFHGSFTAQCKFTAKVDKCLQLSDLTDELTKAKRLATKGLADNYILFTNARLTGITEENIRQAFEAVPGVKRFSAYGCERISQIIRESPRLRMLIPRVYGLGDLSQILDQRAYDQAQEILSALGDDLAKFILTDAYRQSATALVEHGFVLLLGEPACGKSTIAAALAVGALDEWGCSTVKIRDADDFVKHSNPHEKQLFWVDDAFGPTQIDWGSTFAWSRAFPHINAAIHRGAKVLFTSRDYIYRAARRHLKESALPVMKESQVVIHVEQLSKDEREQILYNHIRLGTQPKEFKTSLIPFLPDVSVHERFSPEIARRLGNPMFTKNLTVSKCGLDNFVESPLELLCEIINTLDDGSRSALALVFMRGGVMPSPVQMSEDDHRAIARLGGSVSDVLNALKSLEGSLLLNSIQGGDYAWRFKHPTVRDAFAAVVAENRDLMDIYLTGAPLDNLFQEVSCGNVGVEGAKVIVPLDRYDGVITRLESFDTKKWYNKLDLHRFLSYRCDREFLQCYIARNPEFISNLSVSAYLCAVSDVDVLVRLHEFRLLPEPERLRIVATIRELAIDVPDSGFLREEIRNLMTQEELVYLLERVRTTLLPYLDGHIDEWRDNYDGDDDPEIYFDDLISALQDYGNEFEEDKYAAEQVAKALADIDQVIEELRSEFPEKQDEDGFFGARAQEEAQDSARSIFDDVDL